MSNVEDLINIYNSSGTGDSPITIQNNKFKQGGSSKSGGGIVAGDSGGSNILIENNVLVDPGQYGIGVAGGTNIVVRGNKIYGRQQSFTNVGIAVWNQSKVNCDSIEVSYNRVDLTNKTGIKNPAWNASNCGTIKGWDTNVWNDSIDPGILPGKLVEVSDERISAIKEESTKYLTLSKK